MEYIGAVSSEYLEWDAVSEAKNRLIRSEYLMFIFASNIVLLWKVSPCSTVL